jgi:transcription elongation factor GreA
MPQPPAFASLEDLDGAHPLVTLSEYEGYRSQLAELRRVRERDLPQLLRAARGFVANDAAEEIAQIQHDVAVVDARIAHLDDLLRDARVFDDAQWDAQRVIPGRVVNVRYGGTGKETAFILSSFPSEAARAVAPRSPVGRALLGRRTGDVVSVELPNGRTETIAILGVTPADLRAAA